MSPVTQILLAGLIFFGAHLVSTVTGFGAGILGLPLLTLVVGLSPARQSLVLVGTCLYVYLAIRWWKAVDLRELGRILLLAVPGLAIGMATYEFLPRRTSTALLGVLVIGVALKGLLVDEERLATPAWLRRALLFVGGIVHGAFTTGGPILVVYCRQALPHKAAFRATLAVLWLLLGTGFIAEWTVRRQWDVETWRLSGLGLPFLVAGILLGEYLHHRVDGRAYSTAVNVTLLVTGGILLATAVR